MKRTFQLQQHQEACAGYVKTRVSEQKEIHDPSIHDQDVSDPAKEVGNVSRILNFLNGSMKTNVLIWCMFMSSSMKAAIRLGPN